MSDNKGFKSRCKRALLVDIQLFRFDFVAHFSNLHDVPRMCHKLFVHFYKFCE